MPILQEKGDTDKILENPCEYCEGVGGYADVECYQKCFDILLEREKRKAFIDRLNRQFEGNGSTFRFDCKGNLYDSSIKLGE